MADEATKTEARASELPSAAPFGPSFFLGQLGAFARDRCPDPAESLPAVELHLATGEVLDLCHVMGLAPGFVALAVRDGARTGGEARMRTELVPYAYITRVTIRPARSDGAHVGFDLHREPQVLTSGASAEEALMGAAAPTLTGAGEGGDPRHG